MERLNQVAIIFGRFNPPHKGHKRAWEEAAKYPHWFVGTNPNTVDIENPLPFHIKEQAMLAIWPALKGHLITQQDWFTMASAMFERYGIIDLICVTDEAWVIPGLKKSNGVKGPHGFYNFNDIRLPFKDVHQAKQALRLSSATSLRAAVMDDNREAFTQAAGVPANTVVAGKPFFDLVKHYLDPWHKALATKQAEKEAKAKAKQEAEAAKAARKAEREQAKLAKANQLNTQAPKEKVMKKGPAKQLAENRHGYDDSGMSLAPGNDEGEDSWEYSAAHDRIGAGDPRRHHQRMEVPHDVYINGRKWKTFGSHSHAHNVAKKIKGATVHKALEESKTEKKEAPKPRNFVAKNAINTGAGAHKDKKKAMKQGDTKHKNKLEFAEGRLSSSLNAMFEEKFRASLKEAVLRADTQYAMPNVRIHPDLDNSSPYKAYRYGVAMAGQPTQDFDPNGPIGQKMITVGYTEAEDNIVRATDKVMKSKSKAITSTGSKELPDTYTTSPIGQAKRNKYGV